MNPADPHVCLLVETNRDNFIADIRNDFEGRVFATPGTSYDKEAEKLGPSAASVRAC